jgi:hypothetical protein
MCNKNPSRCGAAEGSERWGEKKKQKFLNIDAREKERIG